jgi:outer membrane protein assembly factor BamD (BamD/ComL family)
MRRQEESLLTSQANAALRGGDAAGALRLLAEAAQRFPGGVLGQEREVLAIEALSASGQPVAASQRAAAFAQAYPGSIHAARLAPFLPR